MANILTRDDHLARQYKTQKILLWVALGLAIAVLILWLVSVFVPVLNIAAVIIGPGLAFGLLSFAKSRYNKLSILAAGIRGEKMALESLKKLDNEHWILVNKKITYKGQSSELDFIVVGPTGLCIVECKHLAGKIEGDPDDKYWMQTKVSQGGVVRTKKLYSPIKQVNTHLYRLKKLLQEEGFSVHLDSAVYFPDPETQLRLTSKSADTPVFWGEKGAEHLLKYVRKVRSPLTPYEVMKIAEFLYADK